MARVLHTDDRTFSNFQPAELVKLCGVNQGRWPVYVLKELLDNATAALEEFGVPAPMVRVVIDKDFIIVKDNGPGIPDSALEVILDFTQFGGSNRHHKLPTRGAQGNALMTIVGIASVWDLGVEIGRKNEQTTRIDVEVNQVKQTVDPQREYISDKPEGSFVKVELPGLPWKMRGADFSDMIEVVRQFAGVNPHVTFMVTESWSTKRKTWSVPKLSSSKAALTPMPQCGAASWFEPDEFADRMAADVRARPNTKLSAWLSEFLGANIKTCSGVTIGQVAPDDKKALVRLATVQRAKAIGSGSKRDSPGFNPLGIDRMAQILTDSGADKTAPAEYYGMSGTFNRKGGAVVPYLVEVCLVQMPEKCNAAPDPVLCMNRTVLYGSPSFKNLAWREKVRGQWHENVSGNLSTLAQAYRITRGKYSCAWMVHITCPSPGYTGYGKQEFDTSWLGEYLSKCVEQVTLTVRKQMHGEARRSKKRDKPTDTIRKKLFDLIPSTLERDTEKGKLPILLRQLYYGFRKDWYTVDDRELHYGTFCAYVDEYEKAVGHEVCLKDPRGTMYEPHSGRSVRLGTAEVRAFTPKKWEGHTIIFLEKENLASLLRTLRVGKRWDAIIVGAKGFAVNAIRDVLQKYKQLLGSKVRIICLHDADPAGYLIGYDLATNLPRFGKNVELEVIDVGLTVREAQKLGLQDEPFPVVKRTKGGVLQYQEWSKIRNMRRHMLRDPDGSKRALLEQEAWESFMPKMVRGTEKPTWVNSTVNGRRFELNALPPRQFGAWVEEKLAEHGCRKVRPPDSIVSEHLRKSRENLVTRSMGNMFMKMLGNDAVLEVMGELGVPSYDLDAVLEGRPEQHWSYLVKCAGEAGEAGVEDAVKRVLQRRMPGMF
jgi:hypothetical protein